MTKRPTKRGKRRSKKGRESALEVLRLRMEYHTEKAREQIAKTASGTCDPEMVEYHLKEAQTAAEALAPFEHARLTPSEPAKPPGPTKVVRAPKVQSMDEWLQTYASPEVLGQDLLKEEEWRRKLEAHQSDDKPPN